MASEKTKGTLMWVFLILFLLTLAAVIVVIVKKRKAAKEAEEKKKKESTAPPPPADLTNVVPNPETGAPQPKAMNVAGGGYRFCDNKGNVTPYNYFVNDYGQWQKSYVCKATGR